MINKNQVTKIVTRKYSNNSVDKVFYNGENEVIRMQSFKNPTAKPEWEQMTVFSDNNTKSVTAVNFKNNLNVIKESYYDELQRLIHSTNSIKNKIHEIFYKYDNNDPCLLIEECDDLGRMISKYTYDDGDLLINQRGFVSIDYDYDENRRITKERDLKTNITQLYRYETLSTGRTKKYLIVSEPNKEDAVDTYIYDKFGSLLSYIDNFGKIKLFTPIYSDKFEDGVQRLVSLSTTDYIDSYQYF
jgi:hypothetical protein